MTTPTGSFRSRVTSWIGAARSESLEMTTATWNAPRWASSRRLSGKVYIRTLLFRLQHRGIAGLSARHENSAVRSTKGERNRMGEEVPEMELDPGKRLQRPQIRLLPHVAARLVQQRTNARSEVSDLPDVVFGQQKVAERTDVQPPVRRTLQRAVVEVKSIDIHVRHGPGRRCVHGAVGSKGEGRGG